MPAVPAACHGAPSSLAAAPSGPQPQSFSVQAGNIRYPPWAGIGEHLIAPGSGEHLIAPQLLSSRPPPIPNCLLSAARRCPHWLPPPHPPPPPPLAGRVHPLLL